MKKNQFLRPVKIILATSTIFVNSFSSILAVENFNISEDVSLEDVEEVVVKEQLKNEEKKETKEEIAETGSDSKFQAETVESEEEPQEDSIEEIEVEEEIQEPISNEKEQLLLEEIDSVEKDSDEGEGGETVPEAPEQPELPDFPEYDQNEIYEMAMEMMNSDLQSKNQVSRFRSFSSGVRYIDSFLETIVPFAIEDSITSGILPSITIAQGALESAWGLSGLAVNANNIFGIKASSDWKGPVYNVITSEYMAPKYDSAGKMTQAGYWYQVVAPFRKYDSWLGSVRDHGAFFTGTEWRKNNYRFVVGEKDYKKAAQALLNAGYATDPGYAGKLIAIIENYQLYKYDQVPILAADYHVQKHGWLATKGAELSLGHAGDNLRLEDLRFRFPENNDLSVNFSAHIQKQGWVNNVSEGYSAGNEGKSRRMEAIKINLTGESAKNYDIYYRVYADSIGWTGWAKNGDPAGSEGNGKKIRSIEIKIAWKGDAPVSTSSTAYWQYREPSVNYISQLQYDGWTSWVKDGQLSGTVGKGRRLEAIQINLSPLPLPGGIEYQTHVQKYGWLPKTANGAMNGTVGEGKRLEAVKVNLTGAMAQHYDVYYRTHIQTYGWTDWAKNGNPSGSEGLGRRMEAMQVKLVKKGGRAPGPTDKAFYY